MLDFSVKVVKAGMYDAKIIKYKDRVDMTNDKSQFEAADFRLVWEIASGKYKGETVNQTFKFRTDFTDNQRKNSNLMMSGLIKIVFGEAKAFADYDALGEALIGKKARIEVNVFKKSATESTPFVTGTEPMEDLDSDITLNNDADFLKGN